MPAHVGPNQGIRYGWNYKEDGWDDEMTADLKRVDALLHRKVINRTTNAPPGSPSDGDRYIVGPSPTGAWAGKSNQIAAYDSESGTWLFYVPAVGWDAYSAADGVTYVWNGTAWNRSSWVNAANFASIQAAIDALPAGGGTVFIPRGTYTPSTPTAFNGITIPANVIVRGESMHNTTLSLAGASTSVDAVRLAGIGSNGIRDVFIAGQGSAGTGRGIVVNYDDESFFPYCQVRDVYVDSTPSWGLEVRHVAVHLEVVNAVISFAKSGGSVFVDGDGVTGGSTSMRFSNCLFNGPSFGTYGEDPIDRGMVHLVRPNGVTFVGCTFESATASTYLSMLGPGYNVSLYGCYLESTAAGRTQYLITASGSIANFSIDNMYCIDHATAGLRFIKTDDTSLVGDYGLSQVTLRNIQMLTATASSSDDISFNQSYDSLLEIACNLSDLSTGVTRQISYTGNVSRTARLGGLQARPTASLGFAPLRLPLDSAADIAAWTGVKNGDIAYDSTNNVLKLYANGAWRTITHT